jgi:hypothetical protein
MVVWTIDGHMFAAYTEAGDGLSVRVPEAEADEDGRQWPRGKPHAADGRGLGPDPLATPPEDLRRRIAASYEHGPGRQQRDGPWAD